MDEQTRRDLASLYGITLDREKMTADPEAADSLLIALSAAMGMTINDPAELPAALEQGRLEQWRRMLDPVLVVREGVTPVAVPIRLPEREAARRRWLLIEENGHRHEGVFDPRDLAVTTRFKAGEEPFVQRTLVLELSLECGYHEFTLYADDRPDAPSASSLLLIVAPQTCYVPPGITGEGRVWGLSLHLHAVRSRRNWGIGDFSDLKEILIWSAEQGAGVLNIAPLHTVPLSDPDRQNPYSPSCRSLLNILFIDIGATVDFQENEEVQGYVGNPKFQARLASLREQDRIDYDGVTVTKFEVFRLLWHHFSSNHLNPETERGRDFRHFQEQGGEILRAYAIFAALQEKFRADSQQEKGWRGWPAAYRDPGAEAVQEFAAGHWHEIELYVYLQWQAHLQLAAIGRRSMELGLKIGLVEEVAFGPDRQGFETWYYRRLYAERLALSDCQSEGDCPADPAGGLPMFFPSKLRELRYGPFINAIRQTMQQAGGLVVRGFPHYHGLRVSEPGGQTTAVSMPAGFDEILAILTLESRRSRCLVVADSVDRLPEASCDILKARGIFTHLISFHYKDRLGHWPQAASYPQNAVVSVSAPFLVTMKGFWDGRDIAVRTERGLFHDAAAEEQAVIARASDRAHLLIALRHADLLPAGYDVDPVSVPTLDFELLTALQVFLARTPSRLLLVAMNDLLSMDRQAEPPSIGDQQFWTSRYPSALEEIRARQEITALFLGLCRERGVGVVRPSAPAADRRRRAGVRIPSASYRLQFNRDFTFLKGADLVEYLSRLGISHVYASPFLMARPGSPHGYDIINHAMINPEIGNREDFEQFIAALDQHGMALLLDIVPNHMGVGSDNHWWMDVLENGEASLFADYFDINWDPLQPELKGRVLLPVLGGHYGRVLENGELHLVFDETAGTFSVLYFEHRFPVAPRTYPAVLGHDLQRLEDRLGAQHNGYLELRNLISSFANLPERSETSEEMLKTRHRNKEVNKRNLARLCRETPAVRQFIEENVILFNGESGRPDSYDLLHALLEGQAYRLAYWRVASDEINYRRFFDINELAGLRMENREVFNDTHQLVLDLITTGKLDGLRVDHPDGLYDPAQYFRWLQSAAAGELLDEYALPAAEPEDDRKDSLYVVAEKILADFENLPADWPVNGTTGYDFSYMVSGLFIDQTAVRDVTSLYHRFIGGALDFADLIYSSKKLIIRTAMAGELNVLTSMLYRLARASRHTRDLPLNRLREGLTEVVAGFPVYRTYITSDLLRKSDIKTIDRAVAEARSREQLEDASVFDFIRSVLLLENVQDEDDLQKRLVFVMKLQQYTGPVMAKGLEDTSFYIYNRLLSLNEVGSNPDRFGVPPTAFHRANQERQHHWPHAMLNSSTHDSKRSEDVRARINVLSEMVPEWEKRVGLWSTRNQALKTRINGLTAPAANDEYAFYQNLLGVWPLAPVAGEARPPFVARMRDCMLKTIREAKEHTSWINPNAAYEKAMIDFVARVLAEENRQFQTDFLPLQQEVAWFGMLNSLSQLLLKLTSPGVPDIYQGNEIWRFCLVDPDNRRPVDFDRRRRLLEEVLGKMAAEPAARLGFLQELLDNLADGRAKMLVTAAVLRFRRSQQDVFAQGTYLPLEVQGAQRRHLCAFARIQGKHLVVVVAPRLLFKLMQGERVLPLGEAVWGDTAVVLPEEAAGSTLENIFTGEKEQAAGLAKPLATAARLLQHWPVGLLRVAPGNQEQETMENKQDEH